MRRPSGLDPTRMRWHYADPPLLWLYPVTYAFHIAEELWLGEGYVQWMRLRGAPITDAIFLVGNGVGLLLMIFSIRLLVRRPSFGWIAVALAVAVLLNTGEHLRASFAARSFSPGLASAVVLWIPLGLLTSVRAWDQASARQWWGGICAALLIHSVVMAVVWGWLP